MRNTYNLNAYKSSLKKKRGRKNHNFPDGYKRDIENISTNMANTLKYYSPLEQKRARDNIRYFENSEQARLMEKMGLDRFECALCHLYIERNEFRFKKLTLKQQKQLRLLEKVPAYIRPDRKCLIICNIKHINESDIDNMNLEQANISQFF